MPRPTSTREGNNMGKLTGYEIRNNNREDGRFFASDWTASKAAAIRRVDQVFEIIASRGTKHTKHLMVVAVDPDNGNVVAGRTEQLEA